MILKITEELDILIFLPIVKKTTRGAITHSFSSFFFISKSDQKRLEIVGNNFKI